MEKLPQSGTAIGRAASFKTFKPEFHWFLIIVPVFQICLHVGQHNKPLNISESLAVTVYSDTTTGVITVDS